MEINNYYKALPITVQGSMSPLDSNIIVEHILHYCRLNQIRVTNSIADSVEIESHIGRQLGRTKVSIIKKNVNFEERNFTEY